MQNIRKWKSEYQWSNKLRFQEARIKAASQTKRVEGNNKVRNK